MTKYHFQHIKNGNIQYGFAHIDIINHIAEVKDPDTDTVNFIESIGGIEDKPIKKSKKGVKANDSTDS